MRFAILGVAVAGGIYYLLNNKQKTGSILDGLADNAGDWTEKAKDFAAEYVDKLASSIKG